MRIPQNQVPRQQTFSNVLVASPGDPKQHQPQRPRDEDAGRKPTSIIDTRTSDNSQTRIEGKLDNLTKGVADLPSKVSDEFMKRCVEFEKQLVTKSLDAEGLRSELQSLKKQLQVQNAKTQKKVKQLKTKSTEAKGLRSGLQSLKGQLEQQKTDSQKKVEQLETKSTEAKDLRSELRFLKKQLQHEQADRQDKVEQLETKSMEAKGLRSELQSLKEQLQEKVDRQDKVAVLTKTIQRLDEDKRHKVSDDEIRQRFVNIRRQIQAVVMHPAYDKTVTLIPPDSANDSDIKVYQRYNSYSLRDRVFVMRAAIYKIIHRCIFSRDALGLAGCASPLDCNQEAQLDQSLCDFEGLLRTRKGAVV
ncbi:hypothetical protein E4U27_002692 [Claviceps purpurea]|nr:hypothetical protein E4U51_001080 [Claviceps purpurea]KAG6180611.1 hypothetical protein E4U27_002692 [Claviceps purpurea]